MNSFKIKHTYYFGFVESEEKEISGKELFPEKFLPITSIKILKIWFGSPPGKTIQSLLGFEITYMNYETGEQKTTKYQGAPITGENVDTKILKIKEGDFLSKINIGASDYITHLKFTTFKKNEIEFGQIGENEKNSVNEINKDINIILNIGGYFSKNGIRALKFDYIGYNQFCFIRWSDILRIRHMIKNKEYKTKLEKEYENFNIVMKCIYKLCLLNINCFSGILKYI